MLDIPFHITLVFILTTLYVFVTFVLSMLNGSTEKTRNRANIVMLFTLMWIIFQSTLALNRWYMDRETVPPHLAFPVITWLLLLTGLFNLEVGRKWIDALSLKTLTWIHLCRLPVELCLYWLALSKQLPWSMTFEGFNYDIIFGITAIPVAVMYFKLKKINQKTMLIWNVLGLISVIAVVVRGIGALPSPIQLWDFSQPNYAVMHFPFIWLPSFVVPMVIFSHLAAIRMMRKQMPPLNK